MTSFTILIEKSSIRKQPFYCDSFKMVFSGISLVRNHVKSQNKDHTCLFPCILHMPDPSEDV